MSMWEIEGLIEYGIRLVDKIEGTNEEKIQLIGNLYSLQEMYDCSFTNFRVMPILLKTGYTKTIDYKEHPNYKGNEDFFEKLLQKDRVEFIYKNIKKEWSEKNKVVAYLEKESRKMYIDYGSPLRKGEPRLKKMYIYDLGLYLIREAHKLKDKGLVYDWTAYLMKFGSMELDNETTTAEEMIEKYFKEIKHIWYSYDYSDYKPIAEALTIFTPGSGRSDGYNEYAMSEDNVEGKLIKYFFNKTV